MKHKKGEVRKDGKVYWRHHKGKGHIWLSREAFERNCEKALAYRRKAAAAYYAMRDKKDVMDRPYFGKYDFAKNKFFVGISVNGKERWVHKNRFEILKKQYASHKRSFVERLKSLPETGLKIGDKHPEDSNKYVLYLIGKKPYFGTLEQLEAKKLRYRTIQKKSAIKLQAIRREKLSNLSSILRKGYVHPETGMVFWEYDKRGNEKWLDKQVFSEKRATYNKMRKERRKLLKCKKYHTSSAETLAAELPSQPTS
jgi:hypothetical protein